MSNAGTTIKIYVYIYIYTDICYYNTPNVRVVIDDGQRLSSWYGEGRRSTPSFTVLFSRIKIDINNSNTNKTRVMGSPTASIDWTRPYLLWRYSQFMFIITLRNAQKPRYLLSIFCNFFILFCPRQTLSRELLYYWNNDIVLEFIDNLYLCNVRNYKILYDII